MTVVTYGTAILRERRAAGPDEQVNVTSGIYEYRWVTADRRVQTVDES